MAFKQNAGELLSRGKDPINELTKKTSANSDRNGKHKGVGQISLYDKGGDVNIVGGTNNNMTMRKLGAPVYDQGGEVSKQNFDRISSIDIPEPVYAQDQPASKGSNPNGIKNAFNTAKTYLTEPKFGGGSVGGVQDTALATPGYMPGGGPAMAAPDMPLIAVDTSKAPVFDKGGEVNVNDGKHQLAILKEKEMVLNPAETVRYKKMGLPKIYDDGGPVEVEEQPQDRRMTPTIVPANLLEQQPKAQTMPASVNAKLDAQTAPEPVRGTPAERQAVQVDKQKAMGQGVKGVTDLGLAKIHEAHLEPQPDTLTLPGSTPRPQPSMGQIAVQGVQDQGAEAQARMPKAAPMDHKAVLAQYDQKISQALNLGTPEGQEQADRLSLAKDNYVQQTPWGSANNHPGFWGKLGHIGEEVASRLPVSRAIMNQIPGTEGFRNAQRQSTLGRIQAETPLTTQRMGEENREAEEKDKASKAVKSPWEPVSGEQFTHYDAQGAPTQQLYRNADTGEQTWRAVPNAEGAAPAQTAGAQAPTTGAPAAGGYYGDKQQPKFAEKPVGQEGTKQYSEQLKATAMRIPKGYDVAQPDILSTDTNATAAEKIKEYNASVNNAILADRSDKAQSVRETEKATAERHAEERADRKQIGYAEVDGKTVLTNKYLAGLNGQTFEPATPGDISKDRSAVKMLNDVQLNVSRYTAAANAYDAANHTEAEKQADAANMALYLNKAGYYDLEASISSGGHITVPTVTALAEKASTLERSEQFSKLSKEAKELVRGYIRTMSAVPAYQKSLTNIGRSNKEMLDLELANIANPTLGTAEIKERQKQFQENVDQAASGFPKLPGLKTHSEVKEDTENKGTNEQLPVPKEVPNNASHIYRDAKGNVKGYALNGQYHALGE